nr:MAG TPA: hypothetical protein [Caudoviricetes sp.]
MNIALALVGQCEGKLLLRLEHVGYRLSVYEYT